MWHQLLSAETEQERWYWARELCLQTVPENLQALAVVRASPALGEGHIPWLVSVAGAVGRAKQAPHVDRQQGL